MDYDAFYTQLTIKLDAYEQNQEYGAGDYIDVRYIYVTVVLLCLAPSSVWAQYDYSSTEAYINDHKVQRAMTKKEIADSALLRWRHVSYVN